MSLSKKTNNEQYKKQSFYEKSISGIDRYCRHRVNRV